MTTLKNPNTMKKAEENATNKPCKDADTVNSIITDPTRSDDDYIVMQPPLMIASF
jgi:hypothetical protein